MCPSTTIVLQATTAIDNISRALDTNNLLHLLWLLLIPAVLVGHVLYKFREHYNSGVQVGMREGELNYVLYFATKDGDSIIPESKFQNGDIVNRIGIYPLRPKQLNQQKNSKCICYCFGEGQVEVNPMLVQFNVISSSEG